MRTTTRRELPIRHAVALGLLHGPTELLPVSSSGHTTLIPWLAGWPYAQLDPQSRKSFEVALHAGTAAALLCSPPAARARHGISFVAAGVLPPVLTGYALGGQIERRLGTPATIVAGLIAGSAAMLAGELRASGGRPDARAGARAGLALGVAQGVALMPGVSRSGATLAAARARGYSREHSDRLSWAVGLPVITGAALLKGVRLARERPPRTLRLALALGGASAFLSTLASIRALRPARRAALLPACVAYRAVLALLVIRRMRDNTTRHHPSP